MPPPEEPPTLSDGRVARSFWANSKLGRVLSYPDFRLYWVGAFVSFTGGWVQNIAQGYFVYELTKDEARLAFVTFCWSMPVAILGFVAGSFADTYNKRTVLIVSQALFACAALFLASATYFGFVQYWHIVVVALFLGTIASIEMPTRQSILGKVVPPEAIPMAVPVAAMTFNTARIVGPAIGALLLARFGVSICYLVNACTFTALIWAVKKIKSDLSPNRREPQPIKDLVFEGMLYTFRDARLKTLFILETITAACGLAYLPLLPAFVQQVLGVGKRTVMTANGPVVMDMAKEATGYCYTAVGIGALTGLLIVTQMSDSQRKGNIIRVAMWTLAIGLPLLSFATNPYVAYVLLACLGAAGVAQFNTTNALFQILSPERLRGRVLAMHVWALNGLSPFGILFFGWLARTTRVSTDMASGGVPITLQVAGFLVMFGAIASLFTKQGLSNLHPTVEPDPT